MGERTERYPAMTTAETGKRSLRLVEHRPTLVPREAISEEAAALLWENYREKIDIEFPSPRTDGCWRLTSLGWIGVIPITRELDLVLEPKTPIANLFRMLEFTYGIPLRFIDGIVDCASMPEFYERLAIYLARRVLDRARKGFHGDYVQQSERMDEIRGRLEIDQLARTPWSVTRQCRYEEHTRDIDDNRILAWTLGTIARSGALTSRSLPTVRRAFRAIGSQVQLLPVVARDCAERTYHRLNEDYRGLHAVCRFFLEHTGPSLDPGEESMLPFLVDMTRLFEMFVGEWLRRNLPDRFRVVAQERVLVVGSPLRFIIDLVIYDAATGTALRVLDTKYKTPETPANEDVYQVVTYAARKRCVDAALIYPERLVAPLDAVIGDIRVRSLGFPLGGDLDAAGTLLLQELFFAPTTVISGE